GEFGLRLPSENFVGAAVSFAFMISERAINRRDAKTQSKRREDDSAPALRLGVSVVKSPSPVITENRYEILRLKINSASRLAKSASASCESF
ncbi:MAG: hypothetical protein AB1631_09885, partial [Acidobacteriota bacterium]